MGKWNSIIGSMIPWCCHNGCALSLSGRIQRWMKMRTTTGPVSPYALKASMAPRRASTSMASSTEGNNPHASKATPMGLASEK